MKTILLADDHGLFRDSMAVWLQQYHGQTNIIFAYDKTSLFKQLDSHLDLIMLDLGMPGMEGIISINELKAMRPEIPILVVSANEDKKTINACLRIGVNGYIPKSSSGQTILQAVSQVLAGKQYFPEHLNQVHTEASNLEQYKFNRRQYELLGFLAQGQSNRDIAKKMHLSEGTIKQYVSQLLDILQVDNRTQAGNKARKILGFK